MISQKYKFRIRLLKKIMILTFKRVDFFKDI